MGYVSESQTSSYPSLNCYSIRGSDGLRVRNVTFDPTQTLKTQWGFRSGPGVPNFTGHIKDRALDLDKHGQWADQATMLELLDEIQKTTTSGRRTRGSGSDVNYRDYSDKSCPPSQIAFTGYELFAGVTTKYIAQGAIQVIAVPWTPPMPIDDARTWGSSVLRSAAPTRPDFNLTRFVGELRDTNRMFDVKNYVPPNPSSYGGGYLNYQFGITPTLSDIQNGAQAIIDSDEHVRQFVRDASRSVHRVRSNTQTASIASNTFTLPQTVIQSTYQGVTIRVDPGSSSTAVGGPKFILSATNSQTQRAGTWFEYYVGDPYGYTSRMDSYLAQARSVVGGGLDLSTTYQLIPFSWMLDWFVDIGSLLNYQQQVADNSLVMRDCFIVNEAHTRASARLIDSEPAATGRPRWTSGARGTAVFHQKTQQRYPGNAFSLSPNWDLNPFQWSIAAAMGLTKADRVPFIKNLGGG